MRLAWLFAVAACYRGDAGPPAPTCTAAAEHVRTLIRSSGARANRIRDVFAMRCSEDAWSDEARGCVVATTTLSRPRHCKAMLTTEQRVALDHDLTALPAVAHVGWMPEECREYRAMIARLGTCTAVPPEMRAAFEQGYLELADAWTSNTRDMPTLEAQCRLLASNLRHVVGTPCGW